MLFNWKKNRNEYSTFALLTFSVSLYISLLFPLLDCSIAKAERTLTDKPSIQAVTVFDEYYIVIDTLKHRMIVHRNGKKVRSFPIAIGTEDTPTPIGDWTVISKSRDWGSGFGTRWLGLDVPWGLYGIHGTNKPYSIGRKASHGCVRMYNRDVETLFQMIPIGTKVTITGYILGAPWELPRRLVEGERGPDVLLIQQRLKHVGYYQGKLDGIYRTNLDRALRKFQLANHITPDRNVSLPDYQALGLEE